MKPKGCGPRNLGSPFKQATNTIDKTTGKKYDDSKKGRASRLKREQKAGMRDEYGYQTTNYEG